MVNRSDDNSALLDSPTNERGQIDLNRPGVAAGDTWAISLTLNGEDSALWCRGGRALRQNFSAPVLPMFAFGQGISNLGNGRLTPDLVGACWAL